MIVKLDDKALRTISEILGRGNDVVIRRKKESFVIIEESKKIKYDPCVIVHKEGQ